MCGWPPYIDVQVCRVDIKCNRGYVHSHHYITRQCQIDEYRDVIKTKKTGSNNISLW